MRAVRMMFNELQKQEYLEYNQKHSFRERALTDYFKRISKKERHYNKDIADMTVDELKDTLISLEIRREDTRGQLISLLRGYIDWAKLRNKSSSEAIYEITAESIDSQSAIASQMLRSPEQLEGILSSTFDYINYENRSKRDSLIFWLLYYGLSLEDMRMLKKCDISVKDQTVIVNNRSYKVSDNIVSLWEFCSKITFLEKKNSRSSASKSNASDEFIKDVLFENDYLFRPVIRVNSMPCDLFKMNTFRNIIAKVFYDYKDERGQMLKISPENIRLSGAFYGFYEKERRGEVVTPQIMATSLNIEWCDKPELFKKTRKWRIDYEDWKHAFWT